MLESSFWVNIFPFFRAKSAAALEPIGFAPARFPLSIDPWRNKRQRFPSQRKRNGGPFDVYPVLVNISGETRVVLVVWFVLIYLWCGFEGSRSDDLLTKLSSDGLDY